MKQSQLQTTAFVLHSRPFQESSLIIQLFSQEHGRFSIIAKGIKGKRSQARRAMLQPFQQLSIEYTGNSELKTLIHCDTLTDNHSSVGFGLTGNKLACGYYANELLIRALPERLDYPTLFLHYAEFIHYLNKAEDGNDISALLRNFEVCLLTALGIAPDWLTDIEHNPIVPEQHYQYINQSGFKMLKSDYSNEQNNSGNKFDIDKDTYAGEVILSLASGNYQPKYNKLCQRITRGLLQEVIGNKPLQSRKLWQHMSLRK